MSTRVLGYWQPDADLTDESHQNQGRVASQLKTFLLTLGYRFELHSVHTPITMAQWLQPGNQAFTWHQDGDEPIQILTWSNIQPTEVRFLDTGELLPSAPGAIILIDNLEVEHRTPSPVHPLRWLIYGWPRDLQFN